MHAATTKPKAAVRSAVEARVMARGGYGSMSVEEVAVEAGVSRPIIYPRYSGKAELATAALAAYRDLGRPEETGDTRADLVARLRHFRGGVERPFGMAMIGSVLAEEQTTPGLLALFRERVVEPRRKELREVLEHARGRGELGAGGDVEAAINMLIGSYYARYLARGPLPGRLAPGGGRHDPGRPQTGRRVGGVPRYHNPSNQPEGG